MVGGRVAEGLNWEMTVNVLCDSNDYSKLIKQLFTRLGFDSWNGLLQLLGTLGEDCRQQ